MPSAVHPRRLLLAVGISGLVVTATLAAGWYLYVRPLSLDEILDAPRLTRGESRILEGRIRGIHHVETTYGPQVFLDLESQLSICDENLIGVATADYEAGDTFRTTLHFKEYTFNGDPGVWAPELFCPFPMVFISTAIVMEAVSFASGITLKHRRMDRGYWTEYQIVTTGGDQYPLEYLDVTLRAGRPKLDENGTLMGFTRIDSAAAWLAMAAIEYVAVTGMYANDPLLDTLDLESAVLSPAGFLRYEDQNGNGALDDGDSLWVRLRPTSEQSAFDTYLLSIGVPDTSVNVATKYIINGPEGPYEWLRGFGQRCGHFSLRHVGDVVNAKVDSTIEIGAVYHETPGPISSYNLSFRVEGGDDDLIRGSHLEVPRPLSGGGTLTYIDVNGDGRVDPGDQLLFQGIQNQSTVHLRISLGGCTVATIDWIPGYGRPAPLLPWVSFSSNRGPPPVVEVNVSNPHEEFALNRTLTVSLYDDGVEAFSDEPLRDGVIASFDNGSLLFADVDASGTFSTGDQFIVLGDAGARHTITVSVLWGYRRYPYSFVG